MNFTEAMNALQQVMPEFVTEVTPINANEAKKEFFLRGGNVPPNFVYDEYTDYAKAKKQVDMVLAELQQGDFSDVQREVLSDFATQVQTKYDLLQAIRDFRHAEDDQSRFAMRQRILLYSVALYGVPDERVYRSLWAKRLARLEKRFTNPEWLSTLRVEDGRAFGQLLDLFQSSTRVDEEPFAPRQETVTKFRDFCWQRWRKSFERVELERTYTPEEVCNLLKTVLREDFPVATKWRAVISENKTSLNVNQKAEEIEIPRYRGKGPYTGKVVLAIILGHELMVHVNRREYARAFCPDVPVSLPHDLEFEEGLAKAVEQALVDDMEEAGVDHYLTAGMAYYDNLSFAEIFNIHRWQLFLSDIEIGDTLAVREQKHERADDEAFRLTLRCMRGTGVVPLMNNLVYYNGYARAWQYIEERIDRPQQLEKMLFKSGKTDPTNLLHQKILESLGWKEEDFR